MHCLDSGSGGISKTLAGDCARDGESDEAGCDDEDDAEDDYDAYFSLGPVLFSLGELVEGGANLEGGCWCHFDCGGDAG